MTIEIGAAIAVVSCFIGVLGFFAGRDKKVATDAEWRGNVNAKLDVIVGIKSDVDLLEERVNKHEGRIVAVEGGAKRAHERIDELRDQLK